MRHRPTHAAAWRPACLLALASLWVHTAGALLDSDAPLAVTGCVAVMETLFTMVHNPPEELARRTVHVSADQPPVPYTHTAAFLDLTLTRLCTSMNLAQYRIEMGILGTQVWGKDEVPFFTSQGHRVPPRLAKVCQRMVRNHKQGMVDALSAGGAQLTGTCEALVGEQLPGSLGERLRLLPAVVRTNPLALLRLAPILIVAAALPLMLAPLVRGPPQVPEPRGSFEPGDSGAPDAADVADVGCMPPGIPGTARSKKKGKAAPS